MKNWWRKWSYQIPLALGDALALAVMRLRGFGRESFAAIHPGGGLGRRLTLKVEDLMHSNKEIGVCLPTAKITDVIFDNFPVRAVRSERSAIMRFVFNRCDMVKPSHFQAESLAATTRAKFNCC